jgi:hypothetical protein
VRLDNLRPLLGGLKSVLLPEGAPPDGALQREVRYVYAVWLRHLSLLARHGVRWPLDAVVELGPGRSLGASLAALLSGAQRCYALDVTALAKPAADLEVLDGLLDLFALGERIPGSDEFPRLHPRPPSLEFPTALLPAALRAQAAAPDRVRLLRQSLAGKLPSDAVPLVRYVVPWDVESVPAGTADLVFSQAVLQELSFEPDGDGLRSTFEGMRRWLRPGGIMSHQIDFSSPFGPAWNEHWTMGDLSWRIVRGRRTCWVNRAPLSTYLALCEEFDFEVLGVERVTSDDGVTRERLASRFRALPAGDYTARSAHLVARRR